MDRRLFRLLYRSTADISGSSVFVAASIDDIVKQSSIRNSKANISGALVYVDDVFVQVLEGEMSSLEVTFERICRDLRHRQLKLVELQEVGARLFGPWSMVGINRRDLEAAKDDPFIADLDLHLGMRPEDVVRAMRAALRGQPATTPQGVNALEPPCDPFAHHDEVMH